jgi:hypothetical protein
LRFLRFRGVFDATAFARTGTDRIDDPVQLTHPKLREFAYQAAWIATVAEDGYPSMTSLRESSGARPLPSGGVPGPHRGIVRGRTDGVAGVGVVHLLPCLGELLGRDLEALTRSSHALDARVVLHLLACQGEVVTRVVEQLASLTYALHRRVALVRRVGHDVFVLARLREGVHDAWHA